MPTMTPARAAATPTPGPACGHVDPELMFPVVESERPGRPNAAERTAIAVCARCPMRADCLERVLDAPLPYGVAGGLTAADRRAVRARRRGLDRPAAPAAAGERANEGSAANAAPTPIPVDPSLDLDTAITRVMTAHDARLHGADPVKVRELALGHGPATASRWEVALATLALLTRGSKVAAVSQVIGENYTQIVRWRDRHRAGEALVRGGSGGGTGQVARPARPVARARLEGKRGAA